MKKRQVCRPAPKYPVTELIQRENLGRPDNAINFDECTNAIFFIVITSLFSDLVL
ncbi:hypothetical protein NCCP2050_34470 [Planococcus sp. NCCP-2050]|nr:hypothetical protein NCCP2050_34470 [Planococcus sp. NCCP-2050]